MICHPTCRNKLVMATNGRQILLVYVWKGARGAPLITDIILGEIPAEITAY